MLEFLIKWGWISYIFCGGYFFLIAQMIFHDQDYFTKKNFDYFASDSMKTKEEYRKLPHYKKSFKRYMARQGLFSAVLMIILIIAIFFPELWADPSHLNRY